MTRLLLAAVAVVTVLASLPAHALDAVPTEPTYLYRAEVTRVIDGDTVVVDIDLGFYIWLRDQRIRLAGIDAPELRDPGGKDSADHLRQLVEGREVILRTIKNRRGGDTRSFNRWLGHVYIDGQDANRAMVKAGHAVRSLR